MKRDTAPPPGYHWCFKTGNHVTPAMAAGLTDRVWAVDDIVRLMDPEAVTVP